MSKKLTKAAVNEKIAPRGLYLVGEYVNNKTKTTFRCSEGHEWESLTTNVFAGSGCPHCSGKALLTKDIVNERIADRGLYLVGEYVNNKTKTTFRCSEGHEWTTAPSGVLQGKGCLRCSGKALLTKDIVNERIAGRGLSMVGEYVNKEVKTTFRCSEGHEWDSTPGNVMKGNGCPCCAGNQLLTKEIVNNRIADKGLFMLGEYVSCNVKTSFCCSDGHKWESTPANVMSKSGCPTCAEYGFNPAKTAELYGAEVQTQCGQTAYIIGITNRTFEDRYSAAERKSMRLRHRIKFENGADALNLENRLKQENKHFLLPKGTRTELMHKGNTTISSEVFTQDVLSYNIERQGI